MVYASTDNQRPISKQLPLSFPFSLFRAGSVKGRKWAVDYYSNTGQRSKITGLYTGEWWRFGGKDGKECPHGQGSFTFNEKGEGSSTYEGSWVQGVWDGEGHVNHGDSYSYEGGWKANKKHGLGVWKLPGGDLYEGEFAEGMIHGKGTVQRTDGSSYSGEYSKNRMHGTGRQKFSNGNVYDGLYVNGKFHGIGAYTWADGHKYEGEFESGAKHGQGKLLNADGQVIKEGTWARNQSVKTGASASGTSPSAQ